MNAAELFVVAFLGGFSGAVMPGPLLTVNIEESMRRGPLTGARLIFGHALLELTLIVAIMFGFGRLLDLGSVKGAIGLIGGSVLLWMAYGMIRESLAKLRLSGQDGTQKQGMPLILAGAVVSLSNPYWFMWWATVGLTFLSRARGVVIFGVPVFFGVLVFFVGHILADLSWYSAVSLAASRGRRLFSDRVYRGIVFVCGLFLVGVSLFFIDSAFGFLGMARPSGLLR